MKTIEQARRTHARMLRQCYAGEITVELFKAMTYGVNTQVLLFRLEADLRLEKTLDAALDEREEQRRRERCV